MNWTTEWYQNMSHCFEFTANNTVITYALWNDEEIQSSNKIKWSRIGYFLLSLKCSVVTYLGNQCWFLYNSTIYNPLLMAHTGKGEATIIAIILLEHEHLIWVALLLPPVQCCLQTVKAPSCLSWDKLCLPTLNWGKRVCVGQRLMTLIEGAQALS